MASKQKSGLGDSIAKSAREFAPFMHLGLQMSLPIVGSVFLGLWLDSKFDTSPLWILIFAAFGIFSSFYYFFKTVKGKKK